jgi:uncharacterized protein YhfF
VSLPTPEPSAVAAFWADARAALGLSGTVPEAWSFGGTPEQADALLALVLAGTKTATAGALWDYEVNEEPLPQPVVLERFEVLSAHAG